MHPRWILISYFLIAGGVATALGALGIAWFANGTLDPAMLGPLIAIAEKGLSPGQDLPVVVQNIEIAMVLAYACGAAIGGFLAGRASPHRSYIEPAIAAALVVGSLLLAIYSTPMGKILISLTRGHLERLASILAATGIVAGLIGAILGELATFGTRSAGFIRQSGLSMVITGGALWSSLVLFGVFFANEVAEQALANLGNPNTDHIVEISISRLATFAGVAAAVGTVAAGIICQLAARSRAVGPAALAAFVVFAVAGAGSAAIPRVSDDLAAQIAFGVGSAMAALAASAAYLVWFVTRSRRR